MIIIIPIIILLTGCSVASYTRTEGNITVRLDITEFAMTTGLENSCFKSSTGELCIGAANSDGTKGLEAIVAGAIKGASMAVKP